MARRDDVHELVRLVGKGHARVVDADTGWPGKIEVRTSRTSVRVAAHVGPIGLTQRDRDDEERRFQNPVRKGLGPLPVSELAGHHTLLLGLWTEDKLVDVPRPVVVAMEVTESRLTKTTRQSLFCPLWLLEHVAEHGWGKAVSGSGERLVAFWPELLPAYLELELAGAEVEPAEMEGIIGASGVGDEEDEEPMDRLRREASVLARNRVFGADVVRAYGGACAMCGLGLGLVEGAHIYPVSAPKSPDKVWNGLCLCPNHHKAFDRHLVWVRPEDLGVVLHGSIRGMADKGHDAYRALVDVTLPQLRAPGEKAHEPRAEMFTRRYGFFASRYDWAS